MHSGKVYQTVGRSTHASHAHVTHLTVGRFTTHAGDVYRTSGKVEHTNCSIPRARQRLWLPDLVPATMGSYTSSPQCWMEAGLSSLPHSSKSAGGAETGGSAPATGWWPFSAIRSLMRRTSGV